MERGRGEFPHLYEGKKHFSALSWAHLEKIQGILNCTGEGDFSPVSASDFVNPFIRLSKVIILPPFFTLNLPGNFNFYLDHLGQPGQFGNHSVKAGLVTFFHLDHLVQLD
jgi:FMN-dependent NADH-azoreductase